MINKKTIINTNCLFQSQLIIMKKKCVLLLILAVFIILSISLNTIYRDFIYSNKIYDFGIADVGYNLFAVTLISLTSWVGVFKYTNNKILDILINTLIYISIEIASYFIPIIGTFDFKDIIALLISCIITLGLLYYMGKNTFLKLKNLLIKTLFN